MKRHLPTLAFAAAALACHVIGSGAGMQCFTVLGMLSELAAWRSTLRH